MATGRVSIVEKEKAFNRKDRKAAKKTERTLHLENDGDTSTSTVSSSNRKL